MYFRVKDYKLKYNFPFFKIQNYLDKTFQMIQILYNVSLKKIL